MQGFLCGHVDYPTLPATVLSLRHCENLNLQPVGFPLASLVLRPSQQPACSRDRAAPRGCDAGLCSEYRSPLTLAWFVFADGGQGTDFPFTVTSLSSQALSSVGGRIY